MTVSDAFKWRVLSAWHVPDGGAFYLRAANIFTAADMRNPGPSSPLGRYVAQVREWGFNGMALRADPEKNPKAMRNFARYLREHDIGLFIRRNWPETELGHSWPHTPSDARPRTSRKLCPYNMEVRAYWADRMARDFELMPDLAGYRTSATQFYLNNGAPWMCDCPTCRARTPSERTRDAIRLMAGVLRGYGGTLFWDTTQDDPWGLRQETYYFRDMTDQIPENAYVMHKRYYWDFRPTYPRHPLYDVISKDAQGRAPYVTQIQQPGEYRGLHEFPWCKVDDWSDYFQDMVEAGQRGVWVNTTVHPDGWDHPLNMVNWYALQRYMRDPFADPAELKLAWAREQFGVKVAPVVVDVVDRVTEAARGTLEFDALFTANHSRFPTLEYLDSHLCGPYRQTKRMVGMMGMVWPLDMYSPQRAAEIRANPRTRLLFDQVPITPSLKAEAMAQKDGAARLMEEAIALWRSLEGKVDNEVYQRILRGLEGNRDDALIFRHMMDLYMDWKLGVLTEAKIDAVLAACRRLRGIVVPDPLTEEPEWVLALDEAASLATFAEQLRRELREPWIARYWQEHSLGVGVLEQTDYDSRYDLRPEA